MVAIQFKRLVSLIALCTLVSSSTIQRVQRADNTPNAQNSTLSTPGKDVGPPAEIHLNVHQPNDNGGNHNSQASSHSPNRMGILALPISHRSVESTNKNPDDKKPNSDAGGEEPSLPRPGVPVLGDAHPPRSLEHQDKRTGVQPPIFIRPTVIQFKNRGPDGNQTKRLQIDGEPRPEAGIDKNFQDGQQKTEGLGELSSGCHTGNDSC